MRSFGGFVLLLIASGSRAAEPSVDFRKDVRPILAEHCFHCHGPDEKKRKGKLRLDERAAALAPAASGDAAIVPKDSAKSTLIQRITSHDDAELMPPSQEKIPLTAKQIGTLKKWIEEGAAYDAGHWAYQVPVKPVLPKLKAHPIDAFVQSRLAREGLKPSPAASAEALIRRISLDIVGLPPTPKEIDEFVVAAERDRPAAVKALVDRLLASPRYGEKWARHWLDLARYSDSNGYEKDLPRQMWAYRDWVIRALNRDLRYDQFLIEQLAGDLLPKPTQDQWIATGFLRNSMVNEEGAIVPEQFRTDEMFDRMDALGKAAFGLTFQCAQCHTHKYDPIRQSEYYGMYAFLNETYESQHWVYTDDQLAKIASIQKRFAEIEQKLKASRPNWPQELVAWEKQVLGAEVPWQIRKPVELASTSGLNHPTIEPDGSLLTLGHPTTRGDVFFIFEEDWNGATALRLEALTHGDLPFQGPGRSKFGTWAISELEASFQKPGSKTWEKLKFTRATADFSEPERKLEDDWAAGFDKDKTRTCGPVNFLIDGKDGTAWRATRNASRRNSPAVAVVNFEAPLKLPAGSKVKLLLKFHHSGDDNGRHNTMLGCCRISTTTAASAQAAPVDYAAVLAMQIPTEKRSLAQQAEVFAAWRRSQPAWKAENDEIAKLEQQWPQAPTSVLTVSARRPEHTRTTRILDRGTWDKPKEAVTPHTPAALHPMPPSSDPPRLRFAKWVADRNSPLAARVAVNRTWQAIFGTGLVETSEDFGTRAPYPEYPEILDWLAVEFMEQGWSQKQLIRWIVTSETYQQSSKVTPELRERDPKNVLLARGPRFRVEAEVLRDMALSISGLLHVAEGGPSIFPPVPASVLEYNYTRPNYWKTPDGPERYRRSVYLFRKRSMPDPLLSGFDAPNGDFACSRRIRSNTPLAALAGLNEPIFVESARALALRILAEGGDTDSKRIAYAYRLCTGRNPTHTEIVALLDFSLAQRTKLADGWLNSREITTGDPAKLPKLPPGCTPQDAAVWTLIARVLLNLDETITKG